MTETTGAGTRLDDERLELLRRKLAERGLSRSAGTARHDEPRMSVGQHRMWFVQSVDPDSALLNICVSYRLTGASTPGGCTARSTPLRPDTRSCTPRMTPPMRGTRGRCSARTCGPSGPNTTCPG